MPSNHDVFISHSSSDKIIADAVCAKLEASHIRCWVAPRDIIPGETWAGSIFNAITNCKVMIMILSGNANSSKHVIREVEIAVKQNVVIVPFRTESIEPSPDLAYFLGATHWLDAMTPPLEARIQDLISCIDGFLNLNRKSKRNQSNIILLSKEISPESVDPPKSPVRSTSEPVSQPKPALSAREEQTSPAKLADPPYLKYDLERAESGQVVEMRKMGRRYESGDGVPKDMSKAIMWYRRSAERGYEYGMCDLANCYAQGKGVPQDTNMALMWYQKAADSVFSWQAGAEALANWYAKGGDGLTQDLAQAVKWYKKIAERGYPSDIYQVAECYAKGGIGLPRDLKEAKAWYQRAAEKGHKVSQDRLKDLY